MNPDRLKPFLAPVGPHNASTQTTKGGASLAASSAMDSRGGVLQVPPLQRSDLMAFQTTFRGGANVLAPPPPAPRTSPQRIVVKPVLPSQPPDVGSEGRSLRDVWKKTLFAQAEGLTTIDTKTIMRPDAAGNVHVLRYQPDSFVMGRVNRPTVEVDTVKADEFFSDGARLMSPKKRREMHDAEVNARLGYLALREAYKCRRKLALNCAINYPHGVLGCTDTPYALSALSSEVYKDRTESLIKEEMKAQRKGRGTGAASPNPAPATGVNIGVAERPSPPRGRAHRCVPPDTLDLSRLIVS